MFNFLRRPPRHFIEDLNSNSLSIILSALMLHPNIVYEKKNLIKMLEPFKHPEDIFSFLIEIEILTPVDDNFHSINLDNEIIKMTMEYYEKIDSIIEKAM